MSASVSAWPGVRVHECSGVWVCVSLRTGVDVYSCVGVRAISVVSHSEPSGIVVLLSRWMSVVDE